jgi:hypothetical protein
MSKKKWIYENIINIEGNIYVDYIIIQNETKFQSDCIIMEIMERMCFGLKLLVSEMNFFFTSFAWFEF